MEPKPKVLPELYRIADVCTVLGVGRSTIYQMIADDPTFPQRVQIGRRAIRWRRIEIERWVRGRPGIDT